jgi:hypothetical protein
MIVRQDENISQSVLYAGRDGPAHHNWAPPGWLYVELPFWSTLSPHISVLESRSRIENGVLASVVTQSGGKSVVILF